MKGVLFGRRHCIFRATTTRKNEKIIERESRMSERNLENLIVATASTSRILHENFHILCGDKKTQLTTCCILALKML